MKYDPSLIFKNSIKIEKIHNPTLEEFQKRISPGRTPVIITGAMDHWPAMKKWTNAYLRDKIGELPIKLSEAQRGVHFDEKKFVIMRDSTFAEFIDSFDKDPEKVANLYAMQRKIPEDIPQLADDLISPIYVDKKTAEATNVWIGPGGNVTPLHFDISENFLCQIRGKKTVLLFPPEEAGRLYAYPFYKGGAHLSRINVADPDSKAFPAIRNARCGIAHIEAGEMLFIPTLWWHGVFGYGQNISLNFWWRINTGTLLRKYPQPVARVLLAFGLQALRKKIGR